MENKPVQIYIEEVIRSKNPKLLKILPRFVISYIKRILHQDEINEFLKKQYDKFGLEFVDEVVKLFNLEIKSFGEENITQNNRYIFAANHPLGGLESMAFIQVVGKHHKNVRFFVNDVLLYLKNYYPILVPLNHHGSQSKEAAKIIDDTYNSDAQILYYPSGLVSRRVKGKITDLEWKKNFIAKAIKYQRDIIPVHIDGRNSNFFYNLANIRQFLGIKANLEMFYLPDEMYKQKNKTITLTFGPPISYKSLTNEYSAQEWANKIKEIVYELPEKIKK